MSFDGQKLLALLPALYRLRDAQAAQAQNLPSGPLQALLSVLAEQIAIVEQDLDQLYDDQFIETCAQWVIPYIGDLVGYQPVRGIPAGVASPRAEVANTIALRRRKGTALALEQLARDVTGWGAHAVEFFQVLAVTQYMNHIRRYSDYAPDLRRWQAGLYIDSGFDRTAHTVDVRRIAIERGRYNLQNVGIFLWSLNAYGVTLSPATPVAGNPLCFRFSPLGCDMPLFNAPQYQGLDIATPAGPLNVPAPLRRLQLYGDIRAIQKGGAPAAYYGAGLSLVLQIDGVAVPATEITVSNLSGADGSWVNMPAAPTAKGPNYAAAIDPELGRIALAPPASGPAPTHDVRATWHYGFNADMGGGPYERADTFTPAQPVVRVPGDFPATPGGIQSALTALAGNGVVEITDSGTYQVPAGLVIDVAPNSHIELRAADECRPTLVLGGEIKVSGGLDAAFDLNGLLVTASAAPSTTMATLLRAPAQRPNGQASQLNHFGVTHCTLVPGWALNWNGPVKFPGQPTVIAGTAKFPGQPTVIAEPFTAAPGALPVALPIVIAKSIVGAIRAPEFATVSIADSIIDANGKTNVAYAAVNAAAADQTGPGAALTLQGCTVIGKVHATLLSLATDCIFWSALAASDTWPAPLWADRKQSGCVSFSCLPPGAITPRQYECVTDGPGTPGPLFVSLLYGDAAYGKLLPDTDDTIRRGADDGGEMGAFHFVLAPLREIDLRARLQEYLPVGLEFGIFYES